MISYKRSWKIAMKIDAYPWIFADCWENEREIYFNAPKMSFKMRRRWSRAWHHRDLNSELSHSMRNLIALAVFVQTLMFAAAELPSCQVYSENVSVVEKAIWFNLNCVCFLSNALEMPLLPILSMKPTAGSRQPRVQRTTSPVSKTIQSWRRMCIWHIPRITPQLLRKS